MVFNIKFVRSDAVSSCAPRVGFHLQKSARPKGIPFPLSSLRINEKKNTTNNKYNIIFITHSRRRLRRRQFFCSHPNVNCRSATGDNDTRFFITFLPRVLQNGYSIKIAHNWGICIPILSEYTFTEWPGNNNLTKDR